jgi:hypothetical protein
MTDLGRLAASSLRLNEGQLTASTRPKAAEPVSTSYDGHVSLRGART